MIWKKELPVCYLSYLYTSATLCTLGGTTDNANIRIKKGTGPDPDSSSITQVKPLGSSKIRIFRKLQAMTKSDYTLPFQAKLKFAFSTLFMKVEALRKYIPKTLYELLCESDENKYFIKFSSKKKVYVLYKFYLEYDADFNKIEKIKPVGDLSADPDEAQRIAKETTGQDLIAKPPAETKPQERGKIILPFDTMKGKRLEEVPVGQLINYLSEYPNRFRSKIENDPFKIATYEYLTQDKGSETKKYLLEKIKVTNTPQLVNNYNDLLKMENDPKKEKILFSRILLPLLKTELENRKDWISNDETELFS